MEGRDPKINTENIILLLAAYPESAVRMLVDPVAGLQTKSTFLPGPDVIKSALESWCAPMVRAAADHARQVQRQALPAPVIRSPEATRQEVTARIKAKHGPGWGIGGDEKWPRDACLRAAAQDALPLTLSAEALAKMAAKQEHSA